MNLYVVKSNLGWCWIDPACDIWLVHRLKISHLSSPTRCVTLNNYFFHSTLCQHSRRIFFQHKAAHQNLHNWAEIIGRSNHVSLNRAGFRARLVSPFVRPPQATTRQLNYRRTLSYCCRQGHSQTAICWTRSAWGALRTERSMRIFDPDRVISSQSKPDLVITYLQYETLFDLANRHRRKIGLVTPEIL